VRHFTLFSVLLPHIGPALDLRNNQILWHLTRWFLRLLLKAGIREAFDRIFYFKNVHLPAL